MFEKLSQMNSAKESANTHKQYVRNFCLLWGFHVYFYCNPGKYQRSTEKMELKDATIDDSWIQNCRHLSHNGKIPRNKPNGYLLATVKGLKVSATVHSNSDLDGILTLNKLIKHFHLKRNVFNALNLPLTWLILWVNTSEKHCPTIRISISFFLFFRRSFPKVGEEFSSFVAAVFLFRNVNPHLICI